VGEASCLPSRTVSEGPGSSGSSRRFTRSHQDSRKPRPAERMRPQVTAIRRVVATDPRDPWRTTSQEAHAGLLVQDAEHVEILLYEYSTMDTWFAAYPTSWRRCTIEEGSIRRSGTGPRTSTRTCTGSPPRRPVFPTGLVRRLGFTPASVQYLATRAKSRALRRDGDRRPRGPHQRPERARPQPAK
jgi:hypothetical protein